MRNALQVIMDSSYLHDHSQQVAIIRDSVARIDWALREILPGHVLDVYEAPTPPTEDPAQVRARE